MMTRLLVFITLLVVLLLAIFVEFSYHAASISAACPTRTWMTCASARARSRPLMSLAIPGSHDSFAYWLDASPDSELPPDIETWLVNILNIMSDVAGRKQVRLLLRNWSQTQALDVERQLEAGVRYFDIRIAFDPKSNTIRFVHMLWGHPVYREIDKLDEFLQRNKREVVILDFNHFYALSVANHQQLTDYLLAKFENRIVSFKKWGRLDFLTLNRLQEQNLQVIIVYHDGNGVVASGNQFWPGAAAFSPWPRTDHIGELISFLNKELVNRTKSHGQYNFFVFQGVLTPTAPLVASRFGSGSLRADCAQVATPQFVTWLRSSLRRQKSRPRRSDKLSGIPQPTFANNQLQGQTSRRAKPAICIADFVEIANFTSAVIALND